ncbi:helix-turn-helix transcriptional regulator [Bifidobacterium aesculapii]|uniref:helix-turn-helix transcriptional regulator n=1 Tax=Bifidobacterium aesculapii TaxID=1329411 RepID=UPI0006E29717|nr:helix-turn-helix transcriptional regulator [Bifidobacterium aesculapii]
MSNHNPTGNDDETPAPASAAKPEKPRIFPEVGAALLKARRECGMTQQQLADATGVSRITIQRIEQAHINPSFKTLEALAHGMGRTLTISFDPQ